MITGDNPLTAAAIAQEAGVDDFLAEATPEAKMELIKAEQEGGKLVAMTGDGTNDAPALAQADVGVAMNTGTTAAKEAGNMVDLDSNPTKLIDVVEIGKQLLITRGSLTTFSIANDVAKYFAIIPALFIVTYPQINALNIMHLHSAAERGALGRDLQRPGDRGPHPTGPARGEVAALGCRRHPAPQRLHLRRGRDHRPLHLHQADRPRHHGAPRLLRNLTMLTQLRRSVVLVPGLPGHLRPGLPAARRGPVPAVLQAPGRRLHHGQWFDPHRPELVRHRSARVTSRAAASSRVALTPSGPYSDANPKTPNAARTPRRRPPGGQRRGRGIRAPPTSGPAPRNW